MNADNSVANTQAAEPQNIINMLRSVQQHHIQLAIMADKKANFVIAASLVTVSLALGGSYAQDMGFVLIGLGVFAAVAAMFAVLAIMPRVTMVQEHTGRRNLLFCGDFVDLSFNEYLSHVRQHLVTDEQIQEAMWQDIHAIGQVLVRKKFYYLAIAYRIFFAGLMLAPIIALIEKLLLMK